jgi:rhodanese-related sulfurtransferase
MVRRLFGGATPPQDDEIDVVEAQRKLAAGEAVLIDVREPDEWWSGHVAGARHIPLGEFVERLNEIPTAGEVLLFCRSGQRSGMATKFMRQQGFERVWNVTGGVLAWDARGLPLVTGE